MDKPLSLTIHDIQSKPFLLATELFDYILPYSYNYYSRWVRLNITKQPQGLPVKGIDYMFLAEVKGIKVKRRIRGGQRRVDYLISPLFAIQLCYQAKTIPAKKVKDFLYKMV